MQGEGHLSVGQLGGAAEVHFLSNLLTLFVQEFLPDELFHTHNIFNVVFKQRIEAGLVPCYTFLLVQEARQQILVEFADGPQQRLQADVAAVPASHREVGYARSF